jgi:hypothetical protein
MHEQIKLDEAKHFIRGMIRARGTPEEFGYELSAFLSAARSVLQYSLAEAKAHPAGQQWYEAQTKRGTVSYFKDKRNHSVHVAPPNVRAHIGVKIYESVTPSDAVTIELRDPAGHVAGRSYAETAYERPLDSATSIDNVYTFDDWKGPEDVIALCGKYLTELEAIVMDGQSRGLLT